jgi:uncharacterized protein (TIGR03067 family)
MLARSIWLFPAALVLLTTQPGTDDTGKKELQRVQGAWVMVALEIDGKEVAADKIDTTTLTIKGNHYTTRVKKSEHECTIRLDPTKKPPQIDMIFTKPGSAPETCEGIYEIKDDTLRIARGLRADQKRPDQFMTWPDTGYFIVTWKRQ